MAKKWIQKAKAKMESSGTIGSFSKAAKKWEKVHSRLRIKF